MPDESDRGPLRADLTRRLGPWQATGVVVSTIIGTGAFLVAAPVARAAGSIGLVLIAWLLGTVIACSGMLCFAELGAAFPRAGGLFVYLTRGLSPSWGFLFGWTDSILAGPVGLAALAAGFMKFAGFALPGIGAPWLTFHAGHEALTITLAQPLAAAVILSLAALNCLSVSVGGGIQLALGSLKVVTIAIIILAGALLGGHAVCSVHPGPIRHGGSALAAMLSALVPVMWAYNGFQYLGNLGAEVRDPARNIPRALYSGMLIVSTLYLLVNLTYFHVLAFERVMLSRDVASDVVQSILGPRAAYWLTAAMGMSALATVHALLMEGARVPYALARTGLFFSITGRIHSRFRSPAGALLFQGTIGALVALTGTFEGLLSLYVFVMWGFLALGALVLIRLRSTAPTLPRPYRTWGYPWTPLLFIAATLGLTAIQCIQQPIRSSLGVLVILAGLPFYISWRRHPGHRASEEDSDVPSLAQCSADRRKSTP